MNELTREQILAMPAGRELDALVRKHVFGWSLIGDGRSKSPDGYQIRSIPDYSTDIAAAWEVAEKFETIEVKRFHTDKGLWFCEIKEKIWHRSYGATAPEAICKAALLAVMGL